MDKKNKRKYERLVQMKKLRLCKQKKEQTNHSQKEKNEFFWMELQQKEKNDENNIIDTQCER